METHKETEMTQERKETLLLKKSDISYVSIPVTSPAIHIIYFKSSYAFLCPKIDLIKKIESLTSLVSLTRIKI